MCKGTQIIWEMNNIRSLVPSDVIEDVNNSLINKSNLGIIIVINNFMLS
jgi:hypothetical protein